VKRDGDPVLPSGSGWGAMTGSGSPAHVPLVPHLSATGFALFRVGAILIPALAIGMYMLSRNEAEGTTTLVQAVLALLAIPILWRLGRIKVRTDDTGITIVNFFRKYSIPWENAFGVRETNSEYRSPQLILNRGDNIALTAINNNGRRLEQLDALVQERRG
jgi:hypothetical protein